MRKPLSLTIAAVAALGVFASPAPAKSISRMVRDVGLTPQDWRIMRDAAQSLYVGTTPRQGAEIKWSNVETGASGTSSITEIRGKCVLLRHEVHGTQPRSPRFLVVQRCKTGDGVWVLMP